MRPLLVVIVLAGASFQAPASPDRPQVVFDTPAGLTVVRYEMRVDGVPVHGAHYAELRDAAGELVHRTGHDGALPAEKRGSHRKAAPAGSEAVWYRHDGVLQAAYRKYSYRLGAQAPIAERLIVDAESGAVLARDSLIFEHAPQGLYTFTRPDGRPLLNPYGDTWPHPTGIPDGSVPTVAAPQSLMHQADVAATLADPWLPDAATTTSGNHAIAFFNSVVEADGEVDDPFGPRMGPHFRAEDGDFFAETNAGIDFVYAYDPAASATDYFQWPTGFPDVPPGVPGPADPADVQVNAKIVQAFYSTNWLHDFLYQAGFDEAAGNAQQSNFGRGGVEGDPILIHAGFFTTFVMTTPDGESPVLALGVNDRSTSFRDSSLDFAVLAHEYGHHVIGRLAGMLGGGDRQEQALHEGIADFFSLLVNVDAGDDFADAYPVGQYYNLDYVHRADIPVTGVTPDAMYYGVRRYPYSTDPAFNPLLFSNLVVPPTMPFYDWKGRGPVLNEPHTAGEVMTVALFECFGGIVAANPGADFEDLRLRMAQYLLGGLTLFPPAPTFLEARNAVLAFTRAANATDYAACRKGFAERGLGAGAIGPARTSTDLNPVLDGFVDGDAKLTVLPGLEGPSNARLLSINVWNTGFVPIEDILVTVTPDVPAAVTLFDGATAFIDALAPDQGRTLTIPLRLNVSQLPVVGNTAPNREFTYTVTATIAGGPEEAEATSRRSELVVGAPATVKFSAESLRVPDGATTATLTVERTGEGTEAIEVEYREGGGSAHSGVNYDPLGGMLSWGDGDMSPKTITVTNIRRAQSGFDVTLLVSLTNPSAAAELGDPALMRVVIPGNPEREGGGGNGGLALLAALLLLLVSRLLRVRQSDR